MTSSSKQQWPRVIAHVDMDCFFVAVERLKNPDLIGKPVIVGGDPTGRGVVSSASYEAREYGVHSAMPGSQAVRLCPNAIFISGSFEDYDHYSRLVRKVLEHYTPLVEMASIDEAYLDLSGTLRLYGTPFQIAQTIRDHILKETGLVASFGVGTNKLIAKIASDYGKPNAITVVLPGEEAGFLAPMNIRKIPGIGPRTEERLNSIGITKVHEIVDIEVNRLASRVGGLENAQSLRRRALGQSESPITTERERKSISKEITFREDISDQDYLISILSYLTEQVTGKMRSLNKKAYTVNLKFRYPDFETHTRSHTLEHATDQSAPVFETAKMMTLKAVKFRRGIRLIGVGVSNFESSDTQIDLFQQDSPQENENDKRRTKAVDQLRDKFGFDSVVSGDAIDLIKQKNLRERRDD